MGAHGVGRDARVDACAVRGRARRVLELPDRPVRPRATWCRRSGAPSHGRPLETTRRCDRRADHPTRRRTSTRSSCCWRRSGSSGPRRSRSRSRRSRWSRSVRFPSSGSRGGTSGRSGRPPLSRSPTSRIRGWSTSAGSRDPSGDVRRIRSTSSASGSSTPTVSLPFAVCAALAMSTGELMGLPIVGLGIWYALARGKRGAGAVIALRSACSGRSSPST